jgi:hypothetical protein
MHIAHSWKLAVAGSILLLSLACGSSSGSGPGGAGGDGGFGGTGGVGGACDVEAVNACLDLQECCRAILVNPVFFQSCNSVVLQCNEARCLEVLEGYVQCRDLEP